MIARISLEDKVAIITGASRGIGESIARTFVANGARVVIASRKIEGVRAVADSLGEGALAVAAHTGREADCEALVAAAIERFGRVDVLVNNAATNPYFGPMLDVDMGAWQKTFEVNLQGYFWMARGVARHLRDRGAPGSIVSVSSVAGLEAAPLQGVYGMTKAAVISMTRTLAYELASSGIRVNAIARGSSRPGSRRPSRATRRWWRRSCARPRSAAWRSPRRSPARRSSSRATLPRT